MLRNGIAKRKIELPETIMARLIRIAEEEPEIISLGPGEPDFVTPKNIREVAKGFLDRGFTHYSPPHGRAELLELIAKKLKRENKIYADPDQIIVTTGSTEGIFLTLLCTLDAGEGAMITDPGFLAYKPSVEILTGLPISIPLTEKSGWQIDVDKMKKLIIPELTKILIINTPTNPTGGVLKRSVLEEIADFVLEHKLLVISDEAYEHLVYDDAKHVSIGSLNGMEENVITLHSCSKTYAMAGFRIGWAVGPAKIIRAMTKVHVYTTICAPTISQLAATQALKGSQGVVKKMVKEYDKRRLFIIKRLNEIGLPCVMPKGAFYVFPNISKFGMPSFRFVERLLKEAKVAVVPGTEFGQRGAGYIRLSYATSLDKIKIAMNRIENFLGKLKK